MSICSFIHRLIQRRNKKQKQNKNKNKNAEPYESKGSTSVFLTVVAGDYFLNSYNFICREKKKKKKKNNR